MRVEDLLYRNPVLPSYLRHHYRRSFWDIFYPELGAQMKPT